jgi:hypothetical protein
VPDVVSEKIHSPKAKRRQITVRPLVDVGYVPFVVAAEKCLAHAIQDLGGMSLQSAFAEKNGESIIGGIRANLDRAAIPAVEHLINDGDLIGVGAVQRSGQRRVGQCRPVPEDGAEEIGCWSAGETGQNPFGVSVQVGEPPFGVESEDALTNSVE